MPDKSSQRRLSLRPLPDNRFQRTGRRLCKASELENRPDDERRNRWFRLE